MEREYFFTHTDTIKETNASKLGDYTQHREDMTNEKNAFPLVQDAG